MAKKKSATLTSQAGSMVYAGRASDNKSNDNPVEPSTDEAPQTVIQHPEFFFDNTLIAIQIENTMFNVHKYQLAKSEVFSDMFKLPKPEGDEPEEGSSPKHPIVIEGVSASDFAALLRVLYASHFSSNQPAPEAPLIIPAFRLANSVELFRASCISSTTCGEKPRRRRQDRVRQGFRYQRVAGTRFYKPLPARRTSQHRGGKKTRSRQCFNDIARAGATSKSG
ncbi:hypothetical protein RSAG8_10027, partial [Rhizoctonia solani AG-8 WAC10335]